MSIEISEKSKKEILELISTPGVEIEEIVELLKIDYDCIMNFLTEEYYKHNLDFGRRLCCRF
ncbi:hypothetical protein LCGC14_0749650 [marine sediment metagenome]|uniref:Uncharacterized protein n=1 Tax=marine sediment metagenome TaxID=412755 RepID=A0A0F9Q8N3_9ZZZZ|nr:hypothetical protein [bacterium]